MWRSDGEDWGMGFDCIHPKCKGFVLKMGAYRGFSDESEHFRRSFRGRVCLIFNRLTFHSTSHCV